MIVAIIEVLLSHHIITVVVMGNLAGAKVTHNYNFYNGDFIGYLLFNVF